MHGEEACMAGGCMARGHAWQGHAWQGACMAGGGCVWQGACMVGGMHDIRSMSGWFTSYWNAFLCLTVLKV